MFKTRCLEVRERLVSDDILVEPPCSVIVMLKIRESTSHPDELELAY